MNISAIKGKKRKQRRIVQGGGKCGSTFFRAGLGNMLPILRRREGKRSFPAKFFAKLSYKKAWGDLSGNILFRAGVGNLRLILRRSEAKRSFAESSLPTFFQESRERKQRRIVQGGGKCGSTFFRAGLGDMLPILRRREGKRSFPAKFFAYFLSRK